VNVPFDASEAAFSQQPGTGVVSGQGFLRQNGGGVVTCAGSDVRLIPVTRYSTARMQMIFRNTEAGYGPALSMTAPEDPPVEYVRQTRQATCDAQGNFRFEGLPPGEYFVTTRVQWMVGYATQGGTLMRRVTVAPGQSQSVMLTS
jgi:hypothetical protein